MATTSELVGFISGNLTAEGRDSVTLRYLVKFASTQDDPYAAMLEAQAATSTPNPVPTFRSQLTAEFPGSAANRYVSSIVPTQLSENRNYYHYDVTWTTPDPNKQDPAVQNPDPIARPGQRNIEYIASEYVIQQARNVEGLNYGDGKGGLRPAFTLGPIVNAAGKRPDEPHVDTEYNGVLVFTKNYPNLGMIDALNEFYQRTTNSSGILGYGPRRLKYLVTESLGQQFENDIEFWPGQTRIEIKRTTDLILDNVGYEFWDTGSQPFQNQKGKWRRALDVDGEPSAEPINLDLNGFDGGDHTSTITYRYLEDKPYNFLFT